MNNKILLFTISISMALVSCKKNLPEPSPITPTIKATKVGELKASESFDWKTTKDVEINIKGLNTLTPINRTLVVSTVDGKSVFYRAQQLMSLSSTISLIIPATVTEIKVNYGTISKTVSISGNKFQFDYTKNN
ncbi:MAG: hypothetical protein KA981_00875 [Bacteroidia bacterium]|nr:hypothetical protein [Bacteroidia bacterium]